MKNYYAIMLFALQFFLLQSSFDSTQHFKQQTRLKPLPKLGTVTQRPRIGLKPLFQSNSLRPIVVKQGKKIEKQDKIISALTDQVKDLKKSFKGLSESQQAFEQEFVQEVQEGFDNVVTNINSLVAVNNSSATNGNENFNRVDTKFKKIQDSLEDLGCRVDVCTDDIDELRTQVYHREQSAQKAKEIVDHLGSSVFGLELDFAGVKDEVGELADKVGSSPFISRKRSRSASPIADNSWEQNGSSWSPGSAFSTDSQRETKYKENLAYATRIAKEQADAALSLANLSPQVNSQTASSPESNFTTKRSRSSSRSSSPGIDYSFLKQLS